MDEKPNKLRFSLQFILLIMTFTGLVLGVLKPWQSPPLPNPGAHNYELVQPEMSLAQVERVLGASQGFENRPNGTAHIWAGPPCIVVEVLLGLDGKAQSVSVLTDQHNNPAPGPLGTNAARRSSANTR